MLPEIASPPGRIAMTRYMLGSYSSPFDSFVFFCGLKLHVGIRISPYVFLCALCGREKCWIYFNEIFL
ncbi:MAG: hypothetical protein JWP12_855 [Bacteroidetes bacterium]|nr:hypothetical protein [Bacteroidota bacterium]